MKAVSFPQFKLFERFCRLIFFLLAAQPFAAPVYAGVITIGGAPDLGIREMNGALYLAGRYEVRNLGTDTAQEVLPELSLGETVWRGDPRTIAPGRAVVWEVSQGLDESGWCSERRCRGAGRFPVLVSISYKDSGGAAFYAPEIAAVSGTGASGAAAPQITAQLAIIEHDGGYRGVLQLVNSSPEDLPVSLAYYSAPAFQFSTPGQTLMVAAGRSAAAEVEISGRGLPQGSIYPVFAVARWSSKGVPQFIAASDRVAVLGTAQGPSSTASMVLIAPLFLLLVFAALLAAARRTSVPR